MVALPGFIEQRRHFKSPAAGVQFFLLPRAAGAYGTILRCRTIRYGHEKAQKGTKREDLTRQGAAVFRRKGKKINDQWLGRELQPYEIASKTMRIGKALAKGCLAADFREALQRYFRRTFGAHLPGDDVAAA